jgi:hypothetical protein
MDEMAEYEMNIKEETSSKLVLQVNRVSWLDLIFALFFFLIWGGLPLLFLFDSGVWTFSCKRIEPSLIDCEARESKLLGLIPWRSFSLKKIERAKGGRHSVVVITKERKVAVFQDLFVTYGRIKRESIASEINKFINSNEASLILQHDLRLNFAVFYAVFWVSFPIYLLVAILLLWKLETFSFERTSKMFIYKKISLFGIKTRCHNFQEITGIKLSYNFFLLTASTNYLVTKPGAKLSSEWQQQIAQKLSDFIKVPVSNKFEEKT